MPWLHMELLSDLILEMFCQSPFHYEYLPETYQYLSVLVVINQIPFLQELFKSYSFKKQSSKMHYKGVKNKGRHGTDPWPTELIQTVAYSVMKPSITLLKLQTLQTCLFLSNQLDGQSVTLQKGGHMNIYPHFLDKGFTHSPPPYPRRHIYINIIKY